MVFVVLVGCGSASPPPETPSNEAPEAAETTGHDVSLASNVVDENAKPIDGALLLVFRQGLDATKLDLSRLDEEVISWGRSNTQGHVTLNKPVHAPGVYSVMVTAAGYEPLIGDGELHLEETSPPSFDPWGNVVLTSKK